MKNSITRITFCDLRLEDDIVFIRQRARRISELIGFDKQEQTKIATSVSEIARNAFRYAGGGVVDFSIENIIEPRFLIMVKDNGKGIKNLTEILGGGYQSHTGMGLGLNGSKKLMDTFHIETSSGGTTIRMAKNIPQKSLPIKNDKILDIVSSLATETQNTYQSELAEQNKELVIALSDLRARQEELKLLNLELEETNRGVVALYAELDEKAEELKRASEMKTSFLSEMTHEFRTPLNSILRLAQMALSEDDGPLGDEHTRQLGYIQKAAMNLSELVNDLLDIAKIEAGKTKLIVRSFTVTELFGGLRGTLRPLIQPQSEVDLIFEDIDHLPEIETDEQKLTQVLRNFIANALKFTERGEIRVSATMTSMGSIRFSVKDTGIGISEQDQQKIFEEFVQIEDSRTRSAKGTGLGLALCKKLTKLLNGRLDLKSEPDVGSEFSIEIPLIINNETYEQSLKQDVGPSVSLVLGETNLALDFAQLETLNETAEN